MVISFQTKFGHRKNQMVTGTPRRISREDIFKVNNSVDLKDFPVIDAPEAW
ncbi:MAG: hypothetical protein Q8N82_08220 [Deltaproteobacteria bacterium]|nr:hypothetical protein [Deltaproteobacteria bacterium]